MGGRPLFALNIATALSLGLDGTDAAFIQRGKTVPTLARIYTAGRGITAPELIITGEPELDQHSAQVRIFRLRLDLLGFVHLLFGHKALLDEILLHRHARQRHS